MKRVYIKPTVKSMILASLSIDTNGSCDGTGNKNWGSKEHTFGEEEWSDEGWGDI